ncbi:MAG: UDP-3-O-(3-hydroxymyristoyl)glucosamine N-acyltransferase [Proteobacteria bacterium]|nr:UDP-3-O-(3-hydroxymyristoyl)glucosamine N-acyltransferase [Pseudomonadota bacterium]
MSLSLSDVCGRFGCEVFGQEKDSLKAGPFSGLSVLSAATQSQLSFLSNERYVEDARASHAGAILCSQAHAELLVGHARSLLLVCKDPYATFARVSQYFFKPVIGFQGVSGQCFVDETARIDPSVTIFPFVYVGPGAVVGRGTVLYAGAFVGAGSSIGDDCILYPNTVVREGCRVGDRCILNPGAVVGGDGFGFAPSGTENIKIPQTGSVELGSDVELGSNASVDRGALQNTEIGAQTKLDSLVQVGHGARIGKACFLAAQTAIAGSTEIGNRVTLAGQVGVAGHLKIVDNVTVLAKSGVTRSLNEAGVYVGFPARPNRDFLKREAVFSQIVKERQENRRPKKEKTEP